MEHIADVLVGWMDWLWIHVMVGTVYHPAWVLFKDRDVTLFRKKK